MNGLKTIMSRVTTMGAAETALNGVNISIKDMGGNIRPVSDILADLAGKWGSLSDEQRQNLGVTVAGRYQLSRFLALMNNFSLATDATSMALDSQGSSMREQAKYADSLQGRINRLDTAWNKLTLSAGTAVMTDGLISVVESLNDLATFSSVVIDKVGLLSGIFGALGVATVLLSTRFRTFTTSLIFGTQGMTRASLATAGLSAGMSRLGIATVGATTALRGLLTSTGVGIVLVAVGFAIEKLIGAYSNAKQKQEEFEQSQQKNIEALTTNKQQTDELIESYKKLSAQKESGNWDVENEKEYLKIQQQLGEVYPNLIDSMDATGQYRIKDIDGINKEIAATQKLVDLKKEETILNARKTFEDNIDDREGFLGLEKKIEAKRKQLEGMGKHDFKDSYVNQVKQELLQLENELAQSSLKINDEVLNVAEAFNKLEIDPTISRNVQDFIYSLNLTELDASELETYAATVGIFTDDMQKAFESGNEEGFNKARDSLISYAQQMGATDLEANALDISFEKVKEESERLKNATYAGADGMGAVETAMDGAGESADKLAESYDNAVSNIKSLNGILDDLDENYTVSADTIGTMLEKYPDLLAYIDDEVTLREKVSEKILEEEKVAKQAVLEKLSANEHFFKTMVSANSNYFKDLADNYGKDLNNAKTLAQLKAQVEAKLIAKLSDAWSKYYNETEVITKAGHDLFRSASKAGKDSAEWKEALELMDAIAVAQGRVKEANIHKELDDLANIQFDNSFGSTFDNLAEGIDEATESAKKNSDELENSIYITDKFKVALEKLNLALEKQRAIQAEFPKHSKEYQNALKKEIDLLDEKKELLEDQTKSLKEQIKSGKIQQTGIIKSSGSSSYSTASGGGASSQIWNFFKSKGFTDNVVAAIMGNLQQESGLSSSIVNKSSGAFGVAQWLGSRKTALSNYADSKGTSISNLQTQLDFLWKELTSTEKKTLNYLKNNQNANIDTLTVMFENLFERAGGSALGNRKKYANDFYSQFAGSVASASNSIVDYYLKNFKKSSHFGDTKNRDSAHKGLDFSNGRSGDLVKALQGGKVIRATYSETAGNWVVIQQDDGTVAKYMHMQNGLNVKSGQRVSAGDTLGKVGNTGESYGAHLHLQIEQNGTPIDPEKYLQGLSSGETVAEQMQSIDEAKSEMLSLQQEALQIESQMQELYMSLVEAQLSSFDRIKQSYADDLSKIDLVQRREVTTSKEWINQQHKKESILKKQVEQEQKAIKFLKEQIKANKDLNAAQKALLEDQLVDRYQELYSLEQGLLDERIAMAEQVIDTYKQSLEAQKKASLDAIDEIINGINKEVEEADYKKKLEDAQKDRQELMDEIAMLSLDDSDSAKKRIAELNEQLQESDESIFDMQEDKAREDRISNLNEQKEGIETEYDNLLNDERKFAQMRSDIINANSKQIQKDLDGYYANIKSNTKILGQALSNNLIDLINQANRYLNGKDYKPIKVASMASGGYTGEFSGGKFLLAHEKELILNKSDTSNLLKTIELTRGLLGNIKIPKLNLGALAGNNASNTGNTFNINMHIDKLTGDQNGAKTLLNELVKGVKLQGGLI